MNKSKLPSRSDFASPEEEKDIFFFLWNKPVELEDWLNQNGRNSSVPSSQQPLHNKAKKTTHNRMEYEKKQGDQSGHKGHRRQLNLIEGRASAEQYLPDETCYCGGCIILNRKPLKRLQIFGLPDISYKLVKHQDVLQEYVPDVQMKPILHSFISIQAMLHHQSIGIIQSMSIDIFQLNFSTDAISAAQGRVTEYLADTHTQTHETVKEYQLIMVDETSHQSNNYKRSMWAALSNDVAFSQINVGGNQHAAKRQLCWAHILRNVIAVDESVCHENQKN